MKFAAVFLFAAFVATAFAGPINVSDNNVGDIVTVGINANLEISNQVEQNIIAVILAYLNDQSIVIGRPGGDDEVAVPLPAAPKFEITPEMIETFKNLLAKNWNKIK